MGAGARVCNNRAPAGGVPAAARACARPPTQSDESVLSTYSPKTPPPRRQRFSLLFHGFGSKRALLHAFASDALTDGGVLSIRGAAPGVTARAVLAAAAGALAHKGARGAGCEELLAAIQAEPPARRLYILLHNIDGPGARFAFRAPAAGRPAARLLCRAPRA